MHKQVYELTPEDLAEFPVWFFPMDETVEDEASVRPVMQDIRLPDGYQKIVRCTFEDAAGRKYTGYAYEGAEDGAEYTKPVLWAGDICVTFWNGMQPPDGRYLDTIRRHLGRDSWPIKFESTPLPGLPNRCGTLDGVYYLDEDAIRCVRP